MIETRAQFGYRSIDILLFASLLTSLAFDLVDTGLVNEGLKKIFGWNATAVGSGMSIVPTVLVLHGHDWLHKVFSLLRFASFPLCVILSLGALTAQAGGHANALDLAFAPATGTPQYGGLISHELLAVLRSFRLLDMVGADVVEATTAYDHAEITGITASHGVDELLSAMALTPGRPA